MKQYTNTQCKHGKLVPKKVRMQVYKQAVEIIKSGRVAFGIETGYPLCLLLPCVLWSLDCYLDSTPLGELWNFKETPQMFKELKEEHLRQIENASFVDRNDVRLAIVESFLTTN